MHVSDTPRLCHSTNIHATPAGGVDARGCGASVVLAAAISLEDDSSGACRALNMHEAVLQLLPPYHILIRRMCIAREDVIPPRHRMNALVPRHNSPIACP